MMNFLKRQIPARRNGIRTPCNFFARELLYTGILNRIPDPLRAPAVPAAYPVILASELKPFRDRTDFSSFDPAVFSSKE
jgi:hypothetical protein